MTFHTFLKVGLIIVSAIAHGVPSNKDGNANNQYEPQVIIEFIKNSEYNAGEENVYSDGQLSSKFNESKWNRQCCSNPDFFTYSYSKEMHPSFVVTNNSIKGADSIFLTNYSVNTHFTNGLTPKLNLINFQMTNNNNDSAINIKKKSSITLEIDINCHSPYNSENYWTALSIHFTFSNSLQDDKQTQTISAYFVYVCDEEFRPIKYALGLTILTLFLVVIVFFLAIFSKPHSISWQENFRRYEIQWYDSWVYAVLIILIAPLNKLIDENILEYILDIIIGIISGAAAWFMISELQCHFKTMRVKVKKTLFKIKSLSFQVMDIVSMILTAVLLFLWKITGKSWWASNLLALCILGTMMKLLKFKALKQAFIFLFICLLVDSIGGFIVFLSQTLSYDTLFINNFNQPFLIAIPSIRALYDKWCNWLPVTGTAFPGILINLCYRFDKSQRNMNTKTFTYIGSISYVLGSTAYMIISTFNVHTWPYSLINYPIMSLCIFLFAYKRGDHLVLWNGSFYDDDNVGQTLHLPEDSQNDTICMNNRLYHGLTMSLTPEIGQEGNTEGDYSSTDFQNVENVNGKQNNSVINE